MPSPSFNKGSNPDPNSHACPNREFDLQIALHTSPPTSLPSPQTLSLSASMGIHHSGPVGLWYHPGGVLHQIQSSTSTALRSSTSTANTSDSVLERRSVQTITGKSNRAGSEGGGEQRPLFEIFHSPKKGWRSLSHPRPKGSQRICYLHKNPIFRTLISISLYSQIIRRP